MERDEMVLCPFCGAEMEIKITRKDRSKQFWGCSQFFDTGCKGYRPLHFELDDAEDKWLDYEE